MNHANYDDLSLEELYNALKTLNIEESSEDKHLIETRIRKLGGRLTPQENSKEIGGWLILLAAMLVLGILFSAFGLMSMLAAYSNVAQAGYGTVFTLELVAAGGLFAFLIYATAMFFEKKRSAPEIIINLFILEYFVYGVLFIFESIAGAEVFAKQNMLHLPSDVLFAMIWIPYLLVSERVKETFIH